MHMAYVLCRAWTDKGFVHVVNIVYIGNCAYYKQLYAVDSGT
jgi:hypothetical protein